MKSGSRAFSESNSFSSRGGASRSGPDASAARNAIPVSRVTTTAVARTGCPHLGVTSTAKRCHAFGFSAAGTSELVSNLHESCSPAARRHAYKGSENSTATDATFTSKGRAHFSAAVNRVRSPGTARFVRNPATHRNARSTPLARAPSRASKPARRRRRRRATRGSSTRRTRDPPRARRCAATRENRSVRRRLRRLLARGPRAPRRRRRASRRAPPPPSSRGARISPRARTAPTYRAPRLNWT
mmetsp:Transcript_6954/g.28553  ORF Transcript_6954/g.28553 Transcript_6954/m.28553 type:complete len:243 (+) Transcript_6954:1293-2021(+)